MVLPPLPLPLSAARPPRPNRPSSPLGRPGRRASDHLAARRPRGRLRVAGSHGSAWTGGSAKPRASGSPTPAQRTDWRLGVASPFPVQQLQAVVLDGKIWLAGGLT